MRANIYRSVFVIGALGALLAASAQAHAQPAHRRQTAKKVTTVVTTTKTVSVVNSSPDSAPPEISSAYQQIDNALLQGNANGVFRFYAPNAVLFQVDGHAASVESVEANVRQSIQKSQSISSKTTIQSVHVQLDGATVILHQAITATDIDPKTGILNTTQLKIDERDHWIRVGGQWKINRVRVLAASELVNGQSVAYGAV